MKVLILIAHCDMNGHSHSHQIAEASKEALLASGQNEVRVVDLMKSGFNKTLNEKDFKEIHDKTRFNMFVEYVKDNLSAELEEQTDHLCWATHVIVCGPMWWLNYPAVFYSWMEKVFSFMNTKVPNSSLWKNGPNRGKKICCCITTANPCFGHGKNISSLDGIFCQTLLGLHASGFTVLRSQPFLGVLGMTEADFGKVLDAWKLEVLKLDQREELNFRIEEGLDENGMDGCQLICGLDNPVL